MNVMHTTEVAAIFVIFLPILAKHWLPWQRPLDPCNHKCLLWIDRPRKPPWICRLQLKLRPFCDIFAYFGQNLVATATSLTPSQSEISYLDWSTPKTIPYKNQEFCQ